MTHEELRQQYLQQYKEGDIEGAIATIDSLQDDLDLYDATFFIRLLLHSEQKKEAKRVYNTYVKPTLMQSNDFETYSRKEAVDMLTYLSNMSFYFNVFNKPNDYINAALDLLQRVDYNEDVLVVANTLYNIGELQYLLQKVDMSVEYLLRAEDYILNHFSDELADQLYDILIRIYTKLSQNYEKNNITKSLLYIRKAKDIYMLHKNAISQTHKLMYLWQDAKLTVEKYGFNKVSHAVQDIIDELQNTSSSYIKKLILEYIYYTYITLGLQDLATVVFSQLQLDENDPWWSIFAVDALFMNDDVEWDRLLYIVAITVHNRLLYTIDVTDMFKQRLLELFSRFGIDKYIVAYKLTEYSDLRITQRTNLVDIKTDIDRFFNSLCKIPTLDDYYLLLQMLFQGTVSTSEIKKTIYSLLFRNNVGNIELRKIGFLVQSKMLGDSTNEINIIIGELLLMYINDVIGERVFDTTDDQYVLSQYNIVKEILFTPRNIREFDDIIAYIYNILETIGFLYCFEITPTVPNAKQYVGGNKYLMQYKTLSKKIIVDDISRFNIYIKVPHDANQQQTSFALLEQFYVYLLRETVSKAFFNVYGSFDGLTGVYNNASGRDIIERLLYSKLSDREGHSCITLVFIDIDHFKQLNDTYGHDTGDKLLIELAQKFVSILRKTDYVIRWGGDEFVLLLVNDEAHKIKSNRQVENIVNRIRHVVKQDNNILLRNLEFSYGYILDKQVDKYLDDAITRYKDQKRVVEDTMRYIIEYADMRMYKYKRRRR